MSLEPNEDTGYGWMISCDRCSNVLELDYEHRGDAMEKAKRDGWNSSATAAGWVHRCPVCDGEAE
jgi:hypothetical protein